MCVLVIDYGMGNLGSVRRALEECGAETQVSDNPNDIASADRLVLPGVGAFAQGMRNLDERGWSQAIRKQVLESHLPILGICLGMQLLADKGYEGGETDGLGLIPGQVSRFQSDHPKTRIPHVGWNEVLQTKTDPLLSGVADGADFYFVHSFRFQPAKEDSALAKTPYCGGFVSAVGRGAIYGVQFHPEKSSRPGRAVLQNFLRI